MFFYENLKHTNEFLKKQNRDLQLKIEELEKENKKLVEDFAKNYRYVITSNLKLYETKLYQNGKEIQGLQNIEFTHELDNLPELRLIMK